jgi:hypothetical protein
MTPAEIERICLHTCLDILPHYGMYCFIAIMTHRTSFALDELTAQRNKRLATRWNVSQAEVVRRSLEKNEQAETTPPDAEERIAAARRLRESLRKRNVDVAAWIQTARDSRR